MAVTTPVVVRLKEYFDTPTVSHTRRVPIVEVEATVIVSPCTEISLSDVLFVSLAEPEQAAKSPAHNTK
jgi:hypothetical protein